MSDTDSQRPPGENQEVPTGFTFISCFTMTALVAAPGLELVNGFKRDLCLQAENVLTNFFPQKVLELDALLKSVDLNVSDPGRVRVELDIPIPDPERDRQRQEKKKAAEAEKGNEEKEKKDKDDDEDKGPPCGPVPCNEGIVALLRRVKPEIALVNEKTQLVALWLQVHVPKIEDGNNFGVQVQEKVLEAATAGRARVETLHSQLAKYFQERGDAVAKAAKEQHVGDYRELVHQIDEKQLREIRVSLLEIRNLYALLYDIIYKNIDKIKRPRGLGKAHIY